VRYTSISFKHLYDRTKEEIVTAKRKTTKAKVTHDLANTLVPTRIPQHNLAGRQADDSGLEERLFIRLHPRMLDEIKTLAQLEGRTLANMSRHMLEHGLHFYRRLHAQK
jgi:hypothetical protein